MFDKLTGFGGNLFDEFRRLEEQMDEMLGNWHPPAEIRSVARGSYPPINMGATRERVDIYLFASGLDAKAIDISMQQNLLIVSGERPASIDENAAYYRRERFDGPFRRVVTLPDDVDPDQVAASYRDGVLHIEVKRREAPSPRRISVSSD